MKRTIVKIVIALAAISAVAAASAAGADPRVHRGVKHHGSRHLHARHRTPDAPLILSPVSPIDDPGYRYGGPLYSTCDRINADRMLAGTCR